MEKKTGSKCLFNIQPNFQNDWLSLIIGFGESTSLAYILYRFLLISFYLFMHSLAILGVLRVWGDLVYTFAGMHFVTTTYWVANMLATRHKTSKSLKGVSDMIKQGIFSYENEDITNEQIDILQKVSSAYTTRMKTYKQSYIVVFPSVMVISPLLAYIFIQADSKYYSHEMVNIYIPHLFYTPFNNKTLHGFTLAYLMDLTFWMLICMTSFGTVRLLTLVMLQLELHLKILNHSLSTVKERALRLYNRNCGAGQRVDTMEDVMEKKEFEGCLYACLTENARHHQALMKFKDAFTPFVGHCLLIVYSVVVPMIYAALIYLLLQPIPISMKLRYISMLFSEGIASFFVSMSGEDVIQESGKMFDRLYETDWYNSSVRFKRSLHIMMSMTRLPMKYVPLFINASASRESFGELVKASYTIMNLLGPSQGI